MTTTASKKVDALPAETTVAHAVALVRKYALAMYTSCPDASTWGLGYEAAKSAVIAFAKQYPPATFAVGMAWHAHMSLREGIANEATSGGEVQSDAVNLFNALALYLSACGYEVEDGIYRERPLRRREG